MLLLGAKVLKIIIMRNLFTNAHPFSKLIYSLFIIFASFTVLIILGIVIAIPIFDLNIFELDKTLTDISNPGNLNFLKYLQTIQSIGLFIIPAFIIGFLFDKNSLNYLVFRKTNSLNIYLVFFVMLFSLPVINFFAKINADMHFPEFLKQVELWMKEKEDAAQGLTEIFLKMDNPGMLFFNIFMIGVLPAIGEELIFRGILQRIFAEWTKNIHWGILIAAILFSGMHFQFFGFIPRFLLGVLFGYLFYWSKSIWVPILAHFINNTVAVIAYYFYFDKVDDQIETFGTTKGTYYFLIISVIILSSLLWYYYSTNKKITEERSGY